MSLADRIKANHQKLSDTADASINDAESLQAALELAPQETQEAILNALGLSIEDKAKGGQALEIAGKIMKIAIGLL